MAASKYDNGGVIGPAIIFLVLVVGQSRDDVPMVVQAGGHHPGLQLAASNTPQQRVTRRNSVYSPATQLVPEKTTSISLSALQLS